MHEIQRAVLIGFLFLALSGSDPKTDDPSPVTFRCITDEYFVGTWVGDYAGLLFEYRLELRADGTGCFASIFIDSEPHAYYISNWKRELSSVTMDSVPIDESAEMVHLRATTTAGVDELKLTVRGKDWDHESYVVSEDRFEERREKLKKAMSAACCGKELSSGTDRGATTVCE